MRIVLLLIASLLVSWLIPANTLVRAQTGGAATASACIGVYLDVNGNGTRDADESGLTDINLSLSVASGMIVTNFVTQNSAPHCFENIGTGIDYTLLIQSPDYMPASSDPIILSLAAGEQLAREFPLVIRPPETAPTGALTVPLNMQTRLFLSALCSLGTMTFLGAVGLLIYGMFLYPRKLNAEQQKVEKSPSEKPTSKRSPTAPQR